MLKSLFKSQQRQLTERAIKILKDRGNTNVKANLPKFEAPQKVVRTATQESALPDISAVKDGRFRIFAVETDTSIPTKASLERWKLFSEFADQNNALFFIAFAKGQTKKIQDILNKNEINARLWEIASGK